MVTKTLIIDPENEWAFLKVELDDKPATAPYPERIVRAREILLKLQVLLSAYENERQEEQKRHFAEKYVQTKQIYLQLAYGK